MIGLAAAAGLVAGGTAVWSAFDPGTPGQSPAPLWLPPPATIQPQAATVTPTPTPDDHGGRRDDPTSAPTSTGSSKSTTEPGDDKGGSGNSGSGSGKTTDNSGKGSDDNSGHG
jgi:hypothetical protein